MELMQINKTKFFLIFILILFLKPISSQAHSPDLSTLMIHDSNGKSIVQFYSSLTAFQTEMDYIYKNKYKNPDEFIDLVKHYFKSNLLIVVNQKDTLKFDHLTVLLGHETKVIAEVHGFPKKIESIYIVNNIFSNFPRSQNEVVFVKEGLPKKQYILNKENNFEINLELENNSWKIVEFSFYKTFKIYIWILITLLSIFGFYIIYKQNKNSKS